MDGTNYNIWSKQFTIAVTSKNKIGFLNDDEPEPSTILYPAKQKKWVVANTMVHLWIINDPSLELSPTFLYVENSKTLWDKLKERFQVANGPVILLVQQKIANCHQRQDCVRAYYTKLTQLWYEYDSIHTNIEVIHEECLTKFLLGLNESMVSIRGQIMAMELQPSID